MKVVESSKAASSIELVDLFCSMIKGMAREAVVDCISSLDTTLLASTVSDSRHCCSAGLVRMEGIVADACCTMHIV